MSSSAITAPLYLDPTKAADGSAAAPSFAFANSTSTGVYRVSANTLGISTAGVQRVVVDSSGNVGVGGTPTSQAGFTIFRVGSASTNGLIDLMNNGTQQLRIFCSGTDAAIRNDATSGNITFTTKDSGGLSAERMRLDASGNLLVGKTSASANGTGAWLYPAGGINLTVGGATGYVAGFYTGGGSATSAGAIFCNSSSTVQYITTSDYRLKEDVQPMAAALFKVAALKPCTYKWKIDGSEGEGFIAHELAEVCPAAVCGEKDAVNEDGSIKSQGIDPSKLVALLTAAIQELSAKVDAQAAEIAELKAKP